MDAQPHLDDGAFTIDGFCDWAGIGRTATYEEINSGKLRAKKRKGRTLIPKQNAREWLASLPDMKAAAAA
jgi:hypothetical protein